MTDDVTVHHGDALDVLAGMPDASVDAVVTDPPYGLEFMGKDWDAPWKQDARAGSATTVEADGIGGFQDGQGGNAYSRSRVRTDTRRHGGDMLAANHGYQQWCEAWAVECLRLLRPGGHLLAFGGSRTFHRLACAIEDAGFEIRDTISWLYGSGFPKSLDVSKAIDRARNDKADVLRVTTRLAELAETAGISRGDVDAHMGTSDMGGWWLSRLVHRSACPSVENWARLRDFIPGAPELDDEVWRLNGRKGAPGEAWERREILGSRQRLATGREGYGFGEDFNDTAPATDDARRWQGWGTALKPAWEPVIVARKPLAGTVAANVLAHGTGALNITATRIHTPGSEGKPYTVKRLKPGATLEKTGGSWRPDDDEHLPWDAGREYEGQTQDGRWPANVVLDEDAAAQLDRQSGTSVSNIRTPTGRDTRGVPNTDANMVMRIADTQARGVSDFGGASRFYYTAKAAPEERPRVNGVSHPTIKPLELMRWLVRLVTPPGGLVLDPFAGSGTTGEACIIEGFRAVLIEREADYLPLIEARLSKPIQPTLGGTA